MLCVSLYGGVNGCVDSGGIVGCFNMCAGVTSSHGDVCVVIGGCVVVVGCVNVTGMYVAAVRCADVIVRCTMCGVIVAGVVAGICCVDIGVEGVDGVAVTSAVSVWRWCCCCL